MKLKRISDDEIRVKRNSHNDTFYTAREFNADKAVAQAQLEADQETVKEMFKEIRRNDTGADSIDAFDDEFREIHSFPDGFMASLEERYSAE